jgi:hypothetical protein
MNTEAILLQYISVINRQQDNMNNIIRVTQRQTDNLSTILLEYLNDRRTLTNMLRRAETNLRAPAPEPAPAPARNRSPLFRRRSMPHPPPQPRPSPPRPSPQAIAPILRPILPPQVDSVITPIVRPPLPPPPPPPDSIFQFSAPTSDASTTMSFRTRNNILTTPLFTRLRPLSNITRSRTRNRTRFPSLPGFSPAADSDVGQDILNATMNDSPVRIRPSRSQIRRATRLTIFRNIEHDEESICPIDREILNEDDNVLQIIHCGHYFRESNLRTHFTMSTRCPLCRYDIREYIPDYSEHNESTYLFPSRRRPLELPSDIENPFATLPSANINTSPQTTDELQAISNVLNRLDNSGNIISIEYSFSLATVNDAADDTTDDINTREHMD